jgi:hypothetical protein
VVEWSTQPKCGNANQAVRAALWCFHHICNMCICVPEPTRRYLVKY